MDAEAARRAGDQRRCEQFVRVQRWRRRLDAVVVVMAICSVVATQLHWGFWAVPMRGWPPVLLLLSVVAGVVSMYKWVRCTWTIWRWETGKTISIPKSRLYW
ncbi:hypothetical protein [Streptomyces iconiensis]|uniref:Uncharacterized protein n=1 Tax=Streptomyces iconiensis TaxID=1384038 RepID=A0ABT7A4H8_9ACTN|nr:hypothetical protein [Streptomyces iconiensis]MDJ1136225.1 hypothetical protein [Streptomyces iconiensis]